MHPEHHSIVLKNKETVKNSIERLTTDLQETEIQFHGRSLLPDMNSNFIDIADTNIDTLDAVMYRKERGGRGASRGKKKHNFTSERYYKLREKETADDDEYMRAINVMGMEAAKAKLDQQHIFSRMYKEASELQKATMRHKERPKKKSQAPSGRFDPFWAGSNPPHLAPGTYNCSHDSIEHNTKGDGKVTLPVRASFNDTRDSHRDMFLKIADKEVVDIWEDPVDNPYSKRSAKSSMGLRGVLNSHKNPLDFTISGGRRRSKSEGLTPQEFLSRLKERERKSRSKDYTFGGLPPEYGGPVSNETEEDEEEDKGGDLRGGSERLSVIELSDSSLRGTNRFYRDWRRANGVKIHKKSWAMRSKNR